MREDGDDNLMSRRRVAIQEGEPSRMRLDQQLGGSVKRAGRMVTKQLKSGNAKAFLDICNPPHPRSSVSYNLKISKEHLLTLQKFQAKRLHVCHC